MKSYADTERPRYFERFAALELELGAGSGPAPFGAASSGRASAKTVASRLVFAVQHGRAAQEWVTRLEGGSLRPRAA